MPIDKPMHLIINEIEGDVLDLTRKVALGIHRDVVVACPVKDGRARGSINISIRRENNAETGIKDKDGNRTLSVGAGTIARAKIGEVLHVQSAIPYMQRLEDGHSPQARGFWKQAYLNAKLRVKNA